MRQGTGGEATVTVRARPDEVYDIVTDVRRIPEWSPECYAARWVGGARGPTVGARFIGWNRRGLLRWFTRPRVVAAERPERFAFVVSQPPYGDLIRWTYRLQPGESDDTTRLTETFEMLRDLPRTLDLLERYGMRVADRENDLQRNLETSLERLRAVLER